MRPNIFAEQFHCAEDLFSHGLAYVLNLFPGLGDSFVRRIAVLAGKKSDYFGTFKTCEFVALEFPRDHWTSRPDLRLVCSRRTIHFENKLDSPLSLSQMRRHSELIPPRSSQHLLFVSNIRHRRPELTTLPGYIHPTGHDHFLWVDLLPALDSSSRKGSTVDRLLSDFREALKRRGMLGRTLAGATGSLYTVGSDASHLALTQLCEVLESLGFYVVKKARRESTLRVYPQRHLRYPLLNPVFEATASWLAPDLDFDCILMPVLSPGRMPRLRRQLKKVRSTRQCTFIPELFDHPNGYTYNGDFVLRVTFQGREPESQIDFGPLRQPLQQIRSFLTTS